jgi:hypothetical protein
VRCLEVRKIGQFFSFQPRLPPGEYDHNLSRAHHSSPLPTLARGNRGHQRRPAALLRVGWGSLLYTLAERAAHPARTPQSFSTAFHRNKSPPCDEQP